MTTPLEARRGLRDQFFRAPDAAYRAAVEAAEAEPAAVVDGLAIAWHPSARHQALRFVDAERIPAEVRGEFARPSAEAPHLAAVSVDPHELSFRTYENIVPLDRLFGDVALELTDRKKLSSDASVYAFTVQASPATRAQLARLDALDLYMQPLNAASRGGERFIFHSARLAEAMTDAVKKAMPRALLGGFVHVNPVFRCNRFAAGDANFHHHLDTPYHDAARDHISRYTVLLYLTGGRGEPALAIDGGVALDTIPELTCVVFEQRLGHEGAPYVDGKKVFLRTELIFVEAALAHDPGIAAQFSKACYWTGESIFAPELARHADAYYNRVAAAHWNLPAPEAEREPFVHKQYRGVHFIANGYDFWFPRAGLSLVDCAAITLLDYFNCKVAGRAFRDSCTTQVLAQPAGDTAWIAPYLAGQRSEASPLASLDKRALFPPPEEPDPEPCCPFHCWRTFDASRNPEIVELYTHAQSFARAHIAPAAILMLGQQVVLDPDRFVVAGHRIHVLGKEALSPVNFAACWNSGGTPTNYLDVEQRVGVLQLLVPPILYSETEDGYHLMFDFFRNSWLVQHRQAVVPVPRIRLLPDGEADGLDDDDANPWLDAVDPALVARRDRAKVTTWWAEDTPLAVEIFDHLENRIDGAADDDQ